MTEVLLLIIAMIGSILLAIEIVQIRRGERTVKPEKKWDSFYFGIAAITFAVTGIFGENNIIPSSVVFVILTIALLIPPIQTILFIFAREKIEALKIEI